MDMLILVNKHDEEVGCKEKEPCHVIPVALHRAFSIFIINTKGQMLIHKRQSLRIE